MKKWPVPIYSTRLVRRSWHRVAEKPLLTNPKSVAELLWSYLQDADQEKVIVILMDAQNQLIGMVTAFEGTLDQCPVFTREILKVAITGQAAAIILGHNHPSGVVHPSEEDCVLTKKVQDACGLVGIKPLDHVVVGESGHFSFREEGKLTDL